MSLPHSSTRARTRGLAGLFWCVSLLALVGPACAQASSDAPAVPARAAGSARAAAAEAEVQARGSWLQWRGPLGSGLAPGAHPPIEWSESRNVRWKASLPGLGHSSPIVCSERVFLSSAEPIGEPFEPLPELAPGAHDNLRITRRQRYLALAYDRASGRELWRRPLLEAVPPEGGHATGSYASASPVSDGQLVFFSFGSQGLFCLDLDGALYWKRGPNRIHTKHGHGEGSSPALFGDALLLNWDSEDSSYLLALDKRTGEELWRVERDEPTSWSSPIVHLHEGRAQVIVSAANRVRGYDLEDGRLVWECGGLSQNVVATPIAAGDMLYAGSSYEKQAFLGIRLTGAEGDITETPNLVWYRRRGTPYVPSPLLVDDTLYFLNHYQGFLAQVDAKTGRDLARPMRLEGVDAVFASLVGADGRFYVVDRSGLTFVLSHEPTPRVLARNSLDDHFSATPALVDDELFLRGERFLYCLGEPVSAEAKD